jgi:hypothetical protein
MDFISSVLDTCIYIHRKPTIKKITWSEPLVTELTTWTSSEYDRRSPVNIVQIVETENIENIISSNTLHTMQKRPSYHSGLCNL